MIQFACLKISGNQTLIIYFLLKYTYQLIRAYLRLAINSNQLICKLSEIMFIYVKPIVI